MEEILEISWQCFEMPNWYANISNGKVDNMQEHMGDVSREKETENNQKAMV